MSDSPETDRHGEDRAKRVRTCDASIPLGYNYSVIRAREALYQSRDARNTWVSDSVPHTEHETHTPSYKESHFGNQDSSEAHG